MEKKSASVLQHHAKQISSSIKRIGGGENEMRSVESQPSAGRVSLHQRSLTPVFVDTQLSSTTATSTSPRPHALTLHEYRRKQQDPSPPFGGASKRVRRKPGTPDLTAVEHVTAPARVSPSPSPERPLPESSPSPWGSEHVRGPATTELDTLAALHSEDSIPSFTSLLESYYDRSCSAPPFSLNLSDQSKSTCPSNSAHSPSQGRVRYLKPSKRLPRPNAQRDPRFSHASITPSPLRWTSSRYISHLVSPRQGPSSPSTFALSKISLPSPPFLAHAPLSTNRREQVVSPTDFTHARDQNGTRTPTTLNFGDISFDVVNPHDSLDLRNIETPADRDGDLNEYFETRSEPADVFHGNKWNKALHHIMDSRPSIHTANESDSPTSRSGSQKLITPPRAVYNDLTSAHQAITSRGGLSSSGKTLRLELPLPPQPVAVSPHKSRTTPMSNSSSNLSNFRPEPLNIQKPNDSPSALRRLASIFRSKKFVEDEESKGSTSGSQSIALLDIPSASPPRRAPSIHRQWFEKTSQRKRTSQSAPYFSGPQGEGLGSPGRNARYSISQPDIRHSAYVSNYPDTEADESQVFDNDSIGPEWSTPNLDYSQEVHDQSQLWQFADKPDSETGRMSFVREGPTQRTANIHALNDSTLGSIIGQHYNKAPPGPVQSLTTMTAAGDRQDISPPIEQGRADPNAYRTGTASAGLSQFDFELHHRHSSSDFSDSSSLESATRISGLDPLRISSRLPLSEPPAFLPPHDLQLPNPPFVQRGRTAATEHDTSYGSSYGDTRNLLLLSSSSQPHGSVNAQNQAASLFPTESAKPSSIHLPTAAGGKNAGDLHLNEAQALNRQLLAGVISDFPDQCSPLEQARREELQTEGRLSGISNLSGSLFILRDATSEGRTRPQGQPRASSSNPFNSQPDRPEAIPKMWRELSPASLNRRSCTKEGSNHQPSSSMKTTATDDPDEWETVGDNSKADFSADEIEDHGGSKLKSVADSHQTFPHPLVYQDSDRFRHQRRSSQRPSASILMPSYDFRGGMGFPHHNVLTPSRAVISHQYPRPLGDHAHPFCSSPPDLGSPDASVGKSTHGLEVNVVTPPHRHLEGVHLKSDDTDQHTFGAVDNNRKQYLFSTFPTTSNISSPSTRTPKLNTETCSSMDYNPRRIPHTSPGQKVPKMFPKTSLSTIPSSTRDTPDRMSSCTNCSAGANPGRVNSFAKFSITGPKINLTGTPQGTGMREVGSSEADNSSPGVRFSSSPLSPDSNRSYLLTCNDHREHTEYDEHPYSTPESSPPNSAGIPGTSVSKTSKSTTPAAKDHFPVPSQALAPKYDHSEANTSPYPRSTVDAVNGNRANEGRQRRQGHLHTPSERWMPLYTEFPQSFPEGASPTDLNRRNSRRSVKGRSGKKNSVATQKELIPLRLRTTPRARDDSEDNQRSIRLAELAKTRSFTDESPQPTEIRPTSVSVMGSTKTDAPLLNRPSRHNTVCTRPPTVDEPSLRHILPTPSLLAERRPREKMISWIVFATCIIFPPALIMYGFGYMDTMVASTTKGELLGFGANEKRLARYVGITMTVALVVGIAAFMVAYTVKM
ncbi:MAG: hypothetical protein M1821_001511 [Bathelium mastoideum]|nr:MAG: hypothetical protein M1821_001511 [Bathelium mastoideum]